MKIYFVDLMKESPERAIDIPEKERVLVGRGGSSKVRIESDEETIGADSDSSLKGLIDCISREHCTLYLDSSQPYVVDGNGKRPSKNGTFVDGGLVISSLGTIIEDRSILKLGPYGFQVFYSDKSSRNQDLIGKVGSDSETIPYDPKGLKPEEE